MSKAYSDVCPCRGCDKRKVGCHGKCEVYKKWKASGIEIERNDYCFEGGIDAKRSIKIKRRH